MTKRNGGPIPVALYDRLSTAAQAEEGYAGEGHLRELRAEMARTGRRVVEEVAEADEKRHVYRRPGVLRLLGLAEAGEIREVWAYRWDRYGKGSVPARIEENLGDFGVKVRALNDGGDGPGGRYFRAVDGVRSDIEQEEQAQKTRMGKRQKARQGKILGSGRKPRYGFRYARDGKGKVTGYEPVPEEMAVVARVLGELAAGASIRSVQARLEEDGVPAPRGGPRWTRDTLKKIAREDAYRPHSPEELRALVAEGNLEPEVHALLDPGKKPYGIDYYGRTRSRFLSRETGKRLVEPAPRGEWVAVPVCLEGSGLARAVVDAARRHVEANRATSTAGSREWELSRGFLFCGECGRSMQAVVTRDARYGLTYHYYACPEPRAARPAAPSRCRNRRSHRAVDLEYAASRLFEDNASRESLVELYERAVREEEERLGLGDPAAAKARHERLSGELEVLNAERKGFLKQNARGRVTDGELDDLLAENDAERGRVASEMREAERALESRRRAPAWSPVHAEWYEDPDATHPSEWLTLAASVEQTRAAYRRYGARFEVGADGTLTVRMELPLGTPPDAPGGGGADLLAGLTTTRRRSTRDIPRRSRRPRSCWARSFCHE